MCSLLQYPQDAEPAPDADTLQLQLPVGVYFAWRDIENVRVGVSMIISD